VDVRDSACTIRRSIIEWTGGERDTLSYRFPDEARAQVRRRSTSSPADVAAVLKTSEANVIASLESDSLNRHAHREILARHARGARAVLR